MAFKDEEEAIKTLKGDNKIIYCLSKIWGFKIRMQGRFSFFHRKLGDKLRDSSLKKTKEEEEYYQKYLEFKKLFDYKIRLCYNELKHYSLKEWFEIRNDSDVIRNVFEVLYRYLPEFKERRDVKKLHKIIKKRYHENLKKDAGKYFPKDYDFDLDYVNEHMVKYIEENDLKNL